MPLKKDDSGHRWVEMEFLVPGTPEQVWQAIATGPGMSAWFTPTTVDEHVGGAITFDFGDGSTLASGTVTALGSAGPVRLRGTRLERRRTAGAHGGHRHQPLRRPMRGADGAQPVHRTRRLGRRTGELRERLARLLRGPQGVPRRLRRKACARPCGLCQATPVTSSVWSSLTEGAGPGRRQRR